MFIDQKDTLQTGQKSADVKIYIWKENQQKHNNKNNKKEEIKGLAVVG